MLVPPPPPNGAPPLPPSPEAMPPLPPFGGEPPESAPTASRQTPEMHCAALQSKSPRQSTQRPAVRSQRSPSGVHCLSDVHGGRQASPRQVVPGSQSAVATHCTHWPSARSQMTSPFGRPEQSRLSRQELGTEPPAPGAPPVRVPAVSVPAFPEPALAEPPAPGCDASMPPSLWTCPRNPVPVAPPQPTSPAATGAPRSASIPTPKPRAEKESLTSREYHQERQFTRAPQSRRSRSGSRPRAVPQCKPAESWSASETNEGSLGRTTRASHALSDPEPELVHAERAHGHAS